MTKWRLLSRLRPLDTHVLRVHEHVAARLDLGKPLEGRVDHRTPGSASCEQADRCSISSNALGHFEQATQPFSNRGGSGLKVPEKLDRAVVPLKPLEAEVIRLIDPAGERHRVFARTDAAAALSDVDLHEDFERHPGPARGTGERVDVVAIVDHEGESRVPACPYETVDLRRLDDRRRNEDVDDA